MALTDAKLRAAKPRKKPYKIFDGDGLFIFVWSSGGRLWRFRYKFNGKEKLLALGEYPRGSLVEARKRRDAAKGLLDDGRDPGAERRERKRAKAGLTFEQVAREWFDVRKSEWTPKYAMQIMSRLEADVFPEMGDDPIANIEAPKVLEVLKNVEKRGVLETNRRLKQYASSIFCFGMASGYCKHDPTAGLKMALRAPSKPKHHLKLKREQVGEFLVRLDAYDGEAETRHALWLVMLTATRTTELRAAEWSEFEKLDVPGSELWRIPPSRMKMGEEHLVPLSKQAVAVLRDLRKLTGRSQHLFPGAGRQPFMSNNTMLYALYRLGYKGRTTTHGFRGLFSTEANEHGFNEDWIERQLAHDERNDVRGAYNSAQYLSQRRHMLQWWADELDQLRTADLARREAYEFRNKPNGR